MLISTTRASQKHTSIARERTQCRCSAFRFREGLRHGRSRRIAAQCGEDWSKWYTRKMDPFVSDEKAETVIIDGAVSNKSIVTSGVPLDSVLGPLLFLIHIIDINHKVANSIVRSFAEDTRILCETTIVASTA